MQKYTVKGGGGCERDVSFEIHFVSFLEASDRLKEKLEWSRWLWYAVGVGGIIWFVP